MVRIEAAEFVMGSDRFYPEEAPARRVKVDGFWIDATPVTNSQFRSFVEATGHVTFAELAPDPRDYPGALPHMLRAGSLMFDPPRHPVALHDWAQWWTFRFGATWRKPYGALGAGKIVFQSVFMSTTVQPLAVASSSALSSLPTSELRS
jgi:formylglycine-generating enzyme required for sulfatase activity